MGDATGICSAEIELETGGSVGNAVPEIAFDNDDIRTAAKSAPCSAASFELVLTFVVMGNSTGICPAEIELRMDSVAIGLIAAGHP
jgi:hypothetical protein